MKQMQPEQMCKILLVLFEKIEKKEVACKEKSIDQVSGMIADLNKKIQQKNYD